MNKLLARLSLTVVAAGALWVAGCDSKKSTNSLTPGDPNDEGYQAFEEVVGGINETSNEMISGVFEQVNMIMDLNNSSSSKDRAFPNQYASAETDSFSATYNSDSHYWHTYWSLTADGSGASIVYRDSIQFREGETAVQWPDTSLLTEIRCGQAMNAGFQDDSNAISIEAGSEWNLSSVEGPINNGTEVIVSGSTNQGLNASSLATNCDMTVSVTSSHSNVRTYVSDLASGQSCPSAGSIGISGSLSSSCQGGGSSLNGTWNWMATFDSGNVSISANNGQYSWSYNGVCPPPQM